MRILSCLVLLALLSNAPCHAAVQPLVISEFLASNATGLRDEDGALSDWIEIQNTTSAVQSLAGWHLSDSAGNLSKWTFPATNIPPNGFLVVFASGKNRTQPGAPLHTNFKLDAAAPGEYLGLIKPDGISVTSQYSPAYPTQFPDVSYGFGIDLSIANLVSSSSTGRSLVPFSEGLGDAWTEIGRAHV